MVFVKYFKSVLKIEKMHCVWDKQYLDKKYFKKTDKMYLEWIQWRGQTTFGSGEVNRGQRDEH